MILPWPFVKILLPYLAGLILAYGLLAEPAPVAGPNLLPLALLIPAAWLLLFRYMGSPAQPFSMRQPLCRNLALAAGFVALGAINAASHRPFHSAHLSKGLYIGVVKEQPEPKARSVQIAVTVENELWRLYLSPDSAARALLPGDRILFRALPAKLTNEQNPFAFKAGTYALRKGYNATAFVAADQWIAAGKTARYRLRRSALLFREKWLRQMRADGVSQRDVSLIAALSLGNREQLTDEIRNDFSVTGLAHLLAVSGMNTVLVIAFPLWLLRRCRNRRWLTLWLTLATLILLWAYAFVVGLSPSVCRSVTMFSLLLLGKGLRRKGQAVNILAASAFLWLWFSPLLLFDTGFLLSHLAVASILCFYPLFVPRSGFDAKKRPHYTQYPAPPPQPDPPPATDETTSITVSLLRRKATEEAILLLQKGVRKALHKLFIWCTDFLNLTLSVQPGTLPLSIALFGNLPLWLLPANFWAIPLVSLVVYGTLLHGLFAWLGPLRRIIATGIGATTQLLYHGIAQIAAWPGTQQQLYLSNPLLVALWGLVFCLAWLKHAPRKGAPLIAGLLLAIVTLGIGTAEKAFRQRPEGFILYASDKGAFAHFLRGSSQIIYCHDTSAVACKAKKRLTDPVTRRFHLTETTSLTASDSLFCHPAIPFARNGPLIRMGSRLLVLCHTYPSPFATKAFPPSVKADILWAGTDPRHDMAQLCKNVRPNIVVIAKNLPQKTQRAWEEICREHQIEVRVQQRDGAYVALQPDTGQKSTSGQKKR